MADSVPFFRGEEVNSIEGVRASIERVLRRSAFILSEEVRSFESAFADFTGSSHCVAVANGTDALEIALRALHIGRGDLVAIAANAGFYACTALQSIGAVPVFCEIDKDTMTLSPSGLQGKLGLKPKAVVVTHLYGQLAAVEKIVEIAKGGKISVIEDCAQAHGAERGGRKAGSFGDIGCFSFYPTKNLGALGDGGALTTISDTLAQRLFQLRQYGWTQKYHVDLAGARNSRLDEIQAAILRDKLPKLKSWNEKRRAIAKKYNQAFEGLAVTCPSSLGEDYVAHLYVLRTSQREALKAHLNERGIACDIHYPVPDYLQKGCLASGKIGDLAVTEEVCQQIISLPCFPGLKDEESDKVITAVKDFFSRGSK